MAAPFLQPGDHVQVPAKTPFLALDVRWNAGAQTAFAERISVAVLPLVRGRLDSREHLVFDNQPMNPDGSIRCGADLGLIEVDLGALPRQVERVSLVAFVRPRPNAPRRTLDQLDALSVSVRDGITDGELGRGQNIAGRLGPVSGATVADIVRESNGWSVVAQATGHESGLDGAAATAGVRL